MIDRVPGEKKIETLVKSQDEVCKIPNKRNVFVFHLYISFVFLYSHVRDTLIEGWGHTHGYQWMAQTTGMFIQDLSILCIFAW